MHTISNEFLSIRIAEKGAELQSVFHKKNDLEYLWQAGAEWSKRSPVLFPIVGGLKGGQYSHAGKTFKLGRHGFAREMDFQAEEINSSSAIFLLTSSEKTKAVYPFDFSFRIKYLLEENKLTIQITVENTGEENMFFSVGAHPAFNVPLVPGTQYDDYYLQFNQKESAEIWPLTEDGLVKTGSVFFFDNEDQFPLNKEMFAKDALVFKSLQSDSISLRSDKTNHGLTVHFPGFPYFGLWAANNANFVCIEPWCGIADSENASGNLEEKEGIMALTPKEIFNKSYSIEVF